MPAPLAPFLSPSTGRGRGGEGRGGEGRGGEGREGEGRGGEGRGGEGKRGEGMGIDGGMERVEMGKVENRRVGRWGVLRLYIGYNFPNKAFTYCIQCNT